MINGILCEKLVTTKYNVADNPVTLGNEFTYSNGDTVFYFVNGGFQILYNFGAQPGETWDLGVDFLGAGCSTSIVQVDSIGTININSQNYRWISVSSQAGSSVGLQGKIIERFGSIPYNSDLGHLFPTPRWCSGGPIEEPIFSFTCFEDSTFLLYNVTQNDCEDIMDVGITDKIENGKIEFYPNPTEYSIQITLEKIDDYNISIYDITGKLHKRFSVNSKTINIELDFLNQGIYVIKIQSNGSGSVTKRIIKR